MEHKSINTQCRRRQIESGGARLILKNFDKQKKKFLPTKSFFPNLPESPPSPPPPGSDAYDIYIKKRIFVQGSYNVILF